MNPVSKALVKSFIWIGPRFLPFADAASKELPLARLLRLSLFQVSVGMAFVLLNGTLNRVMIVELGVPAWLVALMVSLPLVFAPFRALIGFKSDTHRSVLGWRRVPYIWLGTMLQFGGFAILPFALLILSGDTHGPVIIGHIAAALAFLMVGAGMHTTQTAGLALATDIAPEAQRPRVVAFLYVMLLVGMVVSALTFGTLLTDFTQIKLIQVVQGVAVVTMLLNIIALWKQEARDPSRTTGQKGMYFSDAWRLLHQSAGSKRLLVVVAFGTAAFSMQDILLEPYGGEILKLSVSQTTFLTAMLASGTLGGFSLAAICLGRGYDPYRLAANGPLVGVVAFTAVIFSSPLNSTLLLSIGTALIGFGGGLFAIGTLVAAMSLAGKGLGGIAVGSWGAVQATAAGVAIALGGAIRDGVSALAANGSLGPAMMHPSSGYSVVWYIELALMFATLVAIGPLIRVSRVARSKQQTRFGLAELPA
ncbi:MAG: BCD family MFS transporter [Pseudolabrys sp.]|nr:BCD family MFS transporter [Pseudolabrys sp.]